MFRNLNAELSRNNLKPKDLAEKLNVSERTVHNKLKGKTEFTLSEINIVSNLFPNVSIDYLFELTS